MERTRSILFRAAQYPFIVIATLGLVDKLLLFPQQGEGKCVRIE